MGEAEGLLSRILETKAGDKRSATAIHRNDDGVEPSPGDEVDRAVSERRPGAGAKLQTEPVCKTLHGGRRRIAGYSRRSTRNAQRPSDTEDSVPRVSPIRRRTVQAAGSD